MPPVEPAAFAALEQHDDDQRDRDEDVYDKENGNHG
jgi:hypothetical protein